MKNGPINDWRSRDLNPGLSACEADTLPLSYTPLLGFNSYFILNFFCYKVHIMGQRNLYCYGVNYIEKEINEKWQKKTHMLNFFLTERSSFSWLVLCCFQHPNYLSFTQIFSIAVKIVFRIAFFCWTQNTSL